ncbi:MAG: hypothetical protein VCC04_15350 [Myxococcota bacterium]
MAGTAQGGEVQIEILGTQVLVDTYAGDSAEAVAAAIAATLLADPALPGLMAEASGDMVEFQAPADTPVVTDAGLWIGEGDPPVPVPGLGFWTAALLGLGLACLTVRKLATA